MDRQLLNGQTITFANFTECSNGFRSTLNPKEKLDKVDKLKKVREGVVSILESQISNISGDPVGICAPSIDVLAEYEWLTSRHDSGAIAGKYAHTIAESLAAHRFITAEMLGVSGLSDLDKNLRVVVDACNDAIRSLPVTCDDQTKRFHEITEERDEAISRAYLAEGKCELLEKENQDLVRVNGELSEKVDGYQKTLGTIFDAASSALKK